MLQIFYQHARSREARLQVALAEIPYLKNRLMVEHEYERGNKHSSSRLGEQFYSVQKFILRKLEGSIKKKIGHIRDQRHMLRARQTCKRRLTMFALNSSVLRVGYYNDNGLFLNGTFVYYRQTLLVCLAPGARTLSGPRWR